MRLGRKIITACGIGNNYFLLVIATNAVFHLATTSTLLLPKASARKSPELASTALKVHKVYSAFPPHDTDLYDIMEVSANATLAEISKSYRNLSRKYHPDKQKPSPETHAQGSRDRVAERLQQIQKAYEILSDDSKRLPYHRYGLIDPNLAAFVLLGPKVSPSDYQRRLNQHQSYSRNPYDRSAPLFEKLDRELLHLIGYDDSITDVLAMAIQATQQGYEDAGYPTRALEDHRVRTIAALLLEAIRPLVEGRLDTRLYSHVLSQDCDRWKKLPLGAQILRAVGRAYRHEGAEFLQKYTLEASAPQRGKQMVLQLQTDLNIGFRRKWRSTKGILEAAAISGRVAMAERSFLGNEKKLRLQQKEKDSRRKKAMERIEYHGSTGGTANGNFLPGMDDFLGNESDEYESLEELEEEQKATEQLQAQQTLLQTLQIEALWKVCKIDLDRIVRKACSMILSGEYFFHPSHQSYDYCNYGQHDENYYQRGSSTSSGWVTSSGKTMDSERARVAAAEAMILTGEIMVQQSKQGTSWKR